MQLSRLGLHPLGCLLANTDIALTYRCGRYLHATEGVSFIADSASLIDNDFKDEILRSLMLSIHKCTRSPEKGFYLLEALRLLLSAVLTNILPDRKLYVNQHR